MSDGKNVTPNNEFLFDLVRDAGVGKLVLPQFQRSFVWDQNDVQELLVSILKKYFIGSLLVMEIDPHDPPFSIRAVEGSNLQNETLMGVSSRLLLDGQQRVTSIYYAFHAPDIPLKGRAKNSTIFFLDLRKFFDGDVDNAVFYKYKNKCKDYELEIGDWQFETLKVPLKDLRDWSNWRNKYSYWLSEDRDKLQAWHKEGAPTWDATFDSVFKYNSPVLTLSKTDSGDSGQLEEICTIFEKLNSTGVKLSVFDLLTARLYPRGVKLDELWNHALHGSELLSSYDVDKSDFGVFVLRWMAMVRRVDLKNKALVKLSEVNFGRDWRKAIKYFDEAYARLTSLQDNGFGVFSQKWLPYTTIIPILAALMAKRDELDDSRKSDATQAIRWWYWGSVFTRRYTGQVETVTARDYIELSRYFEDQDKYPEVFQDVYNEIVREDAAFSLLDVERADNTLYKAVMCMLALNGANDFRSNESIVFSLLDDRQIDDHHIFPQSFLKNSGIESAVGLSGTALVNSIINRTLISKGTNQSISSKAPSVYMKMDNIIPQAEKSKILHGHFIDDGCLQALESDDYKTFLERRHSTIVNQIRFMFDSMPKPSRIEGESRRN